MGGSFSTGYLKLNLNHLRSLSSSGSMEVTTSPSWQSSSLIEIKIEANTHLSISKVLLWGIQKLKTIQASWNMPGVMQSFQISNMKRQNINAIFKTYKYSVFSVLPIYTKLIKGGLKVWVYSGDADGRVPVIGTRYWIEALGLPIKSSWRTWYHDNQADPFSFHVFAILFIKALETNAEPYEHDRVINLPGQPSSPSVSQFSGYITVNKDHGRALFYWFFEAQSESSKKPLLLWLNGGPGCSSIGSGAAVEIGPLTVTKNREGLHFNTYSWNQEANLLFVESPVGVGFSYTNTSSDLNILDDSFVAEDSYNFLVNWLQRFPQFKSREFFISGESYAGHYIPQLAELIFDRNKDGSKYSFINLKGFIVGNPATEDYYDYTGILDYAWSHAVISDQQYEKAKLVCDFKQFNWSKECQEAMDVVSSEASGIDIYNIYAPGRNDYRPRMMRIFGGYDPCYTIYVEEYFNRIDVQSSFHADIKGRNTNFTWKSCNNDIVKTYNYSVFSVLPIYTKLIKGGLKVWVYSGDADGRIPVIGTRYWIGALGLPVKSSWRTWYHDNQVGGRIVEYEGLTFVTIRGAGHLVPLDKPSEAFSLIHSFLSGKHLPTHP
ncbi:hypothetical protein K1719_043730 [Acacia pycnantha]|nr:hypothetical protein K1719_043730 [Acacia pycnantha]